MQVLGKKLVFNKIQETRRRRKKAPKNSLNIREKHSPICSEKWIFNFSHQHCQYLHATMFMFTMKWPAGTYIMSIQWYDLSQKYCLPFYEKGCGIKLNYIPLKDMAVGFNTMLLLRRVFNKGDILIKLSQTNLFQVFTKKVSYINWISWTQNTTYGFALLG